MHNVEEPGKGNPPADKSRLSSPPEGSQKTSAFIWFRLGFYDGFHSLHDLDEMDEDEDQEAMLQEAGALGLEAYRRGFAAGKAARVKADPGAIDLIADNDGDDPATSTQADVTSY
ncbi:MAG: hypothetical protein U0822_10725 [Anaerolineae bacterium]